MGSLAALACDMVPTSTDRQLRDGGPTKRLLAGLCLVAAAAALLRSYQEGPALELPPPVHAGPHVRLAPKTTVSFDNGAVILEISRHYDELEAYAALSGLRTGHPETPFFITVGDDGTGAVIVAQLAQDLLQAVPQAVRFRALGVTAADWARIDAATLRHWMQFDRLFARLYGELGIRRPRHGKTSRLVADVSSLASFFALPVDAFELKSEADYAGPPWGVACDSQDVVLLRSRRKRLCMERSSAEWEETLSALRRADRLYRAEMGRDALPLHLRPPDRFHEELPPPVLLTYAALLLKDLERRAGPAKQSSEVVPDDPNVRHEVGTRRASMYANRALAHALWVNRQWVRDTVTSD